MGIWIQIEMEIYLGEAVSYFLRDEAEGMT
jgi:hypothetical protein